MTQQNNQQVEREFGWDDTLVEDPKEFVTLPAGDYDFRILSFERGRYTPGPDSKMPACNEANLKVEIINPMDSTGESNPVLKYRLFLHSRTEGLLSAFFASIGLKEKGQPAQMNWNIVPGATGKCSVKIKLYNGNQYNEVAKFIPRYDLEPQPQQGGYQAPAQQTAQPAQAAPTTPTGNFTPGNF
ncbi:MULTISPECIES: DUF669 domain-containing protein [unclassified Breznakia]|uniref:DUF669 domain-containing protein n=1 Tax=unclassified Breznakia TaxID=2623764 RepID=UPI0024734E89|nr:MULTISPECIES: DUF669 domain-containing protein [unclassified Breznakia]MDH6367529.1 hypothetical protein [Breznakia sp. PH1-1]MDH6404677.1 hypothetical protein [Breznakia sp. PF1-11]MDH6412359.1 hypothetical protein [Breznakia sp. PFB1-11]MDH6414697.1 hypothetical protein [Breznakia sp. PFB1-14]MDH6417058.1 hypothetical protein [Breznakia sp. PFB1-4]